MREAFLPIPRCRRFDLYKEVKKSMSEEELDDLLGRGAGDPDMWGYPE